MNIKSIQQKLKKDKIDGEIFTLGNLFINEEVLQEEDVLIPLVNFTGSYGKLLVMPSKVFLFVDGRYVLQAQKEVNTKQIEIVKLSEISFYNWMQNKFASKKSQIYYNPWVFSISEIEQLSKILPNTQLTPCPNAEKHLSNKKVSVFPLAKKFAGISSKEKINNFAKYIADKKLSAYLVTSAANVSWLLNLRSNSLPYSPLLRAYLLIEKNGTYKIFAENTDLKNALPFDELATNIKKYDNIASDYRTTPQKILNQNSQIKNLKDITDHNKAIKNKTELNGMIKSHIKDGVALCKFLYWIQKNYKNQDEFSVAEKLLSLRKKEDGFFSESFATIAATGENGAVIHYHATPQTVSKIKKDTLLLVDSGAQYFDGTTDVTRTIAIGTPTPDMIEKNTLVLKSHIALASALFPHNTTGNELDILAREPLLKYNLDYAHGTGHGVGHFSNVHEAAVSISINNKKSGPLFPNMVTSIEPGYYKEKFFGIRIENLYYVKEVPNTKLLQFEVLTLAPLDKKIINTKLLNENEINWINAYHKKVFQTIKKYLTKQEMLWLKDVCAPL